ncbi:hypothetical protein [Leptospira weilii]|nr:hypothetical protein [Leptospira weilii]
MESNTVLSKELRTSFKSKLIRNFIVGPPNTTMSLGVILFRTLISTVSYL